MHPTKNFHDAPSRVRGPKFSFSNFEIFRTVLHGGFLVFEDMGKKFSLAFFTCSLDSFTVLRLLPQVVGSKLCPPGFFSKNLIFAVFRNFLKNDSKF